MSQLAYQGFSADDDRDDQETNTTFSGGSDPVRWQVVTRTAGLMPAQIIAGRLQAEGIPARAWQEAAGQAIGLTVGLLGTGYVAVPEELVAEAQQILAAEDETLDDTA